MNFSNVGFYHEDYKERIRHAKAIILKTINFVLSDDKARKVLNINAEFRGKYKISRIIRIPHENTIIIECKSNTNSFVLIFDFSSQYRAITEKELLQRLSRISKIIEEYRLPRNRLIVFISRKFTKPTLQKYSGRAIKGKRFKELIWLYQLDAYIVKELVKSIVLALLEAIHYFIMRVKAYIQKIKELKKYDVKKVYDTLMELIILYSLFLINYDKIKWIIKLRELAIVLDKGDYDKLVRCLEGEDIFSKPIWG